MAKIVVIADDLTGAADCAASSAALGCRAEVLLHSPEHQLSEAWPDADILCIDANSRCLPVEHAAEATARLVSECDLHNADTRGYVLYKKIDSTLRGNVAAELAALLRARRSANPANIKPLAVIAPALPAQGRTTVDGRLLVRGVPLEQTDIWQLEREAPKSSIPQLLSAAGLSSGLIGLMTVRSDILDLRQAILHLAEQNDVVICDAETNDDLRLIAEASLSVPTPLVLVGSAGLASQLPRALSIPPVIRDHKWSFATGPTLFVIGTAALISKQQAQLLEASPGIVTVRIAPEILGQVTDAEAKIMQSLRSGRDVLLMLSADNYCSTDDQNALLQALAHIASACAEFLGGLVATGGQTARSVLDALGIRRLRLVDEVEAGVPFSIAEDWNRLLPVITKAGAFGSPQALVRCLEFLRKLERESPLSTERTRC